MAKKKSHSFGISPKDVAQAKKSENIWKQFDKWLVEKFGEKFVHGIKKTKNNKRGGKIMQGYKAGGKV